MSKTNLYECNIKIVLNNKNLDEGNSEAIPNLQCYAKHLLKFQSPDYILVENQDLDKTIDSLRANVYKITYEN